MCQLRLTLELPSEAILHLSIPLEGCSALEATVAAQKGAAMLSIMCNKRLTKIAIWCKILIQKSRFGAKSDVKKSRFGAKYLRISFIFTTFAADFKSNMI